MLKKTVLAPSVSKFVGRIFEPIPLSPNQWTALSVLFALAGFYFLAVQKRFLIALVFFAIGIFLDIIDGAIARAKNLVSAKGAFLDGMCDRLTEFMLLYGLILYGIPNYYLAGALWLVLLIFFGSIMTAFTRAYAVYTKAVSFEKVKEMPGLLERTERMLLVLLGMLGFLFLSPIYLTYAIILATALSVITVLQRFIFALNA
ncbi:Archaetidylinositol phosphate synthase [Candidatus Gugararchaeum adminiculabundum]|nr:Archaetidylinositol phosphate synthase [Candidatus Gugararchaeum adminiculabundum]